jgi:hypothetical protein
MGLFTTYLVYSLGKRAQRKHDAEERWIQFGDEDQCADCGHPESRHSEEGDCPTY